MCGWVTRVQKVVQTEAARRFQSTRTNNGLANSDKAVTMKSFIYFFFF